MHLTAHRRPPTAPLSLSATRCTSQAISVTTPKRAEFRKKSRNEIKLLLDGYKSTLAQANMTMDDLVYVQIACTDLAYYDEFNAAYKKYFSKDLPAREFIGAASLLNGGHFEMQAIAVRH
jgi:enamine deaminase RidA (YjgF/YER057c/UK114 family)